MIKNNKKPISYIQKSDWIWISAYIYYFIYRRSFITDYHLVSKSVINCLIRLTEPSIPKIELLMDKS